MPCWRRGFRTPTARTRASRTASAGRDDHRRARGGAVVLRPDPRLHAARRPRPRAVASGLRTEGAHVRPRSIDPGWAEALAPVEPDIAAMGEFLRAEVAAGRRYLPAGEHILRAFTRPFADVRVLIVGQDPYPTPGHPIGLSFAVERDVRPLPPSLRNIYKELHADLGVAPPGARRPDRVGRPRRAAAQPRADGRTRRVRVAPRQGLGGGHRAGDPRARGTRRAAGRDPVGTRRPLAQAVARRRAGDRVGAPVPAVGVERVLRVAAVQPCQRAARRAGRGARRLDA